MGVRVFVRFRPQNEKERQAGGAVVVKRVSDESFTIKDGRDDTQFTFDRIFYSENSTQDDVYSATAKPVVQDVLRTFRSGSVICYGQTGAGKTHTMEGEGLLSQIGISAGIVPRVAEEIFAAAERPDSAARELTVKLAVCEVYQEKIRCLFDPTKDNLQLKDDPLEGTVVAGVTEVHVQTLAELMHLLQAALENRAIGETKMNAASSRSHCVYTVTISGRDEATGIMRTGKLHMVDLAGSEKVDKTGAEGTLLDEAKAINKSLSALGKVIYALTTDDCTHVPFRDSKLTRMLQSSLSGGSQTSLICCCSPSTCNAAETLSTIRFGVRAKEIKNAPVVEAPVEVNYKYLFEKSTQECEALKKRCQTLELQAAESDSRDKDGQAQVALLQECLKDALGGFAPAYQAPSDIDLVESAFSERLKHLKEQCELESGGPDPGLSALLFACELVCETNVALMREIAFSCQ